MRSFGIVDYKFFESDFFLEKIRTCEDLFEAQYYFSAFISAARSITFALQASLKGVNGFEEWYNQQQEILRNNKIARFFHLARNESQKLGVYHIKSGGEYEDSEGKRVVRYYFKSAIEESGSPAQHCLRLLLGDDVEDNYNEEDNVILSSEKYLTILAEVIYNCYQTFGNLIDPQRYYTIENIRSLGLTIEDLEEQLRFPRGWTNVLPDERRIIALRESQPDTEIDYIFIKYLKKDRFGNEVDLRL